MEFTGGASGLSFVASLAASGLLSGVGTDVSLFRAIGFATSATTVNEIGGLDGDIGFGVGAGVCAAGCAAPRVGGGATQGGIDAACTIAKGEAMGIATFVF